MTEVATTEKVGGAAVTADNKITCEVCQADYHTLAGSKNDCPLCNAPGGKGVNFTTGASLEGNPLAPIVDAMSKTINGLSARVAALEASHASLAEKVAS